MSTTEARSDFWACKGRLWHAMTEGSLAALCGREVPPPRMTMKHTLPVDEKRCAWCDRVLFPAGRENDE